MGFESLISRSPASKSGGPLFESLSDLNFCLYKHFAYSGEFTLYKSGIEYKMYFMLCYFIILSNKVPKVQIKCCMRLKWEKYCHLQNILMYTVSTELNRNK